MAREPVDIPTFAAGQLALLDAELAAEREESALLVSQAAPAAVARAGLAIVNLRISAQRTGLGGKSVVELELDPAVGGSGAGAGELPEHAIRTGDIVALAEQPRGSERRAAKQELRKTGFDGVVVRVTARSVSVASDRDDDDADALEGKKIWLCVREFWPTRRCGPTCGPASADGLWVVSSWPTMSRTRGVWSTCAVAMVKPVLNRVAG